MNKGSVDSSLTKRKIKSKGNQPKIAKDNLPCETKSEEAIKLNEFNEQPPDKITNEQGGSCQESDSKSDSGNQSLSSELPDAVSTDGKSTKDKENFTASEAVQDSNSSCIINVEISDGLSAQVVEGELYSVTEKKSDSAEILNNTLTDVNASNVEEENKNEVIQIPNQDYVNPQGVRFTSEINELENENQGKLQPYGLGYIHELFRFLISLCNPSHKQNNEMMIHVGLTLLGVAFEIGADAIGKHESFLVMVKDELCRNLFSVIFLFIYTIIYN